MRTARRDFDYYIDAAQESGKRSDGLWRIMNNLVADILRTSKKRGMTLKEAADALDVVAGPRKKTQVVVAIGNLRIAARRIREGKELTLL